MVVTVNIMLSKNTLDVKKVRGQSEAALQIGIYDQKLRYQEITYQKST